MIKRMLLLSAALMLSLAFATPSHAGSMTYVLAVNFTILAPSGATATDNEITLNYVGAAPTIAVTGFSGPGLPAGSSATIMPLPNVVDVSFGAPISTSGGFYYVTITSTEALGLGSFSFSGQSALITNQSVQDTLTAVPEPSSFALLGIGLSGLIAFRRRFSRAKKLPVA